MNRRDFLKLIGLTALGTLANKVMAPLKDKGIEKPSVDELASKMYNEYGSASSGVMPVYWCVMPYGSAPRGMGANAIRERNIGFDPEDIALATIAPEFRFARGR